MVKKGIGIGLIVVAGLAIWAFATGKIKLPGAAPAPALAPATGAAGKALTNAQFIAALPDPVQQAIAINISGQLGYPPGEVPPAVAAAVASGQLDLSQIDWYY